LEPPIDSRASIAGTRGNAQVVSEKIVTNF
jgi:hypothetical protein